MDNKKLNTMPDYLEKYLETSFDNLHKSIAEVKDQVNGLVTTIDSLKLNESKHYENCPNRLIIEELKKKQEEDETIKKYWKVFAIALIVIAVAGISEAVTIYEKFKQIEKTQSKSIEQIHSN